MRTYLVEFLIVLLLPINLFAQWKRETGFIAGIILAKQPTDQLIDAELAPSLKLGLSQSWLNPEKKFSLRPEIGIELERFSINNNGFGGRGGGSSSEGAIWSINAEIAVMAQIKITKGLSASIGPASKYLIKNYENSTRNWWYSQYSGVEETNEFNRKYFLKPAFGIKAMLLERNLCKKISLGLVFEQLWRNYQEYLQINNFEEILQYSQTAEISVYLGLH